ncbi:MAG: bifunctional 5,10-methylenetetrahydrofolate dehydrogenase/5,10-methenyltetrahydrofolate cyclohydrolase [Trueperaceae bacterium]|nr:bifunctional 5,10-methylenetetrahydrofolate dehydrogenase/5,10-methenyltetrahydrofolate cyclohydrolase [Trueperaceae bacterium]
MSAQVMRGREVATALLEELRADVDALPAAPRLVFVRASSDPASASYVRSKAKLAGKAGVRHETRVLEATASQQDVLDAVAEANDDPDVDGVLVQLPLHDHLDAGPILDAVDPDKDVDGLHPVNVGRLWSGRPGLVPATPAGLMRILDHYRVEIEGRHVVIIGRSELVGKPAAALFLRRHATVTVAHSRTRDLPAQVRRGDIVLAAAGRPGLIQPDMVRAGAVVLDVGQSRVDGSLRGDVAPEVAEVASALTPTPGGTGPMTVAMVVANTVAAARARRGNGV